MYWLAILCGEFMSLQMFVLTSYTVRCGSCGMYLVCIAWTVRCGSSDGTLARVAGRWSEVRLVPEGGTDAGDLCWEPLLVTDAGYRFGVFGVRHKERVWVYAFEY
eukprot:NODE_32_length_32166_cov_0.707737.p22 type:complete len:105 gc:universal NODE_32_length_32166_cov_0.707737:25753-25439(-)